ncbi:MAG: DNA translocase FtsK [Bacilli bacterium]
MQNSKKKIKPYSSQLIFFGGIAISLLSVILIINIGSVTRVFTYPFTYGFGVGSYFLYGTMYCIGFAMLFFTKEGFKIKHPTRVVGYILFFIGLITLMSMTYAYQDGINIGLSNNENYVSFIDHFVQTTDHFEGSYITDTFIDLLTESHFAGGFFGYFLAALLNQYVGYFWTMFISITSIVFGLFFFFFNELVILVKAISYHIKNKRESSLFSELENIPDETTISSNSKNKKSNFKNERVVNIDVIKNASKIEAVPVSKTSLSSRQSVKQTVLINDFEMRKNENKFIESGYKIQEAHYNFNDELQEESFENEIDFDLADASNELNLSYKKEKQPTENKVKDNNQPAFEEVIKSDEQINKEDIVRKDISPINNVNSEPQKREQLTLDFEKDEQLYDEEDNILQLNNAINEETIKIAQTKPVFENPEETISTAKESVLPMFGTRKTPIDFIEPSLDLLFDYPDRGENEQNLFVAENRKMIINQFFEEFNVGARTNSYIVGPSVTRFNVEYGERVSSNSIAKLINDLSIRLGGIGVIFEQIIPGQAYSGLQIPNAVISSVGFKETLKGLPDSKKNPLAIGFGKNITGDVIYADFNKFPHMLLAGTTGSGKSVFIHSIIMTLIMRNSPDLLKLVLIDPKKVELMSYQDIPHLLCPIISEPEQAKTALLKLYDEMERRNDMFSEARSGREIDSYNEWADQHNVDRLPYIIVIVDEFADLVDNCKEISRCVSRLAAKSRSAGIYLLIATQRPSTDVVNGTIKANLPTHVALMCSNFNDSNTIIGESGAEKLLGKGDMLVQCPLLSRVGLTRLQGCYVQQKEINAVVDYLKENYKTDYNPDFLDLIDHSKDEGQNVASTPGYVSSGSNEFEERYKSVKEWVMTQQYISMSKIQRECFVGFNRAGIMFKRLQEEGIVSTSQDGNKGSKVLIRNEYEPSDSLPTSDEVIE